MHTRTSHVGVSIAALFAAHCATNSGQPSSSSTATAAPPRAAPLVRERMVAIRDTRLFVREVGDPSLPTIVVVHGGPGGNHRSQLAFERLAVNYRVVSYDQRGTGESDRFDIDSEDSPNLKKLTLDENVADLEALREHLKSDRIIVVGHSWGGALAAFYAAEYPERIERLVVYSGGPEEASLLAQKKKAHAEKMSPALQATMKTKIMALKAAVDARAPQGELDRMFAEMAVSMFSALYCAPPSTQPTDVGRGGFWANQVASAYSESFDRLEWTQKLKRVTRPALLIWGRCEPSPQERLTLLLDGLADGQFVIFEKSGHNAMEEEPDLFWKTLEAFLNGERLPIPSYRTRSEVEAAEQKPPVSGPGTSGG